MALRALIEIRLSNETEESTSPERQREQDEAYCGIKGWDIVHVCRDLDVSRAVSPFDRGDLGKWLTASERPPIMSRSIFHVAICKAIAQRHWGAPCNGQGTAGERNLSPANNVTYPRQIRAMKSR
jgi:hypothetical protein